MPLCGPHSRCRSGVKLSRGEVATVTLLSCEVAKLMAIIEAALAPSFSGRTDAEPAGMAGGPSAFLPFADATAGLPRPTESLPAAADGAAADVGASGRGGGQAGVAAPTDAVDTGTAGAAGSDGSGGEMSAAEAEAFFDEMDRLMEEGDAGSAAAKARAPSQAQAGLKLQPQPEAQPKPEAAAQPAPQASLPLPQAGPPTAATPSLGPATAAPAPPLPAAAAAAGGRQASEFDPVVRNLLAAFDAVANDPPAVSRSGADAAVAGSDAARSTDQTEASGSGCGKQGPGQSEEAASGPGDFVAAWPPPGNRPRAGEEWKWVPVSYQSDNGTVEIAGMDGSGENGWEGADVEVRVTPLACLVLQPLLHTVPYLFCKAIVGFCDLKAGEIGWGWDGVGVDVTRGW